MYTKWPLKLPEKCKQVIFYVFFLFILLLYQLKMPRKNAVAATVVTLAASAFYMLQNKEKKLNSTDNINAGQEDTKTRQRKCGAGYSNAIKKSNATLKKHKEELGLPGVIVGVSVDGRMVWAKGYGMANVEMQTPCKANTKMRIASISKPITTSLLAKLLEAGTVDLDKAIQEYVPYFPSHTTDSGKPVAITARLLACHKAGIRHYKKDNNNNDSDGGPEFYLKDRFNNTEESVALFSKDDLLFSPGEGYEYTTHGYTLLSAVIEGAVKSPFHQVLKDHLVTLGLNNTHLDEISTLIYGRASYYRRNEKGRLVNAELTDNSYKWAGGGLVSNVTDLSRFANTMLYSYQQDGTGPVGFLRPATVRELWTPVNGTKQSWSQKAGYGLGWTIVPREEGWLNDHPRRLFHVGHSGGAVGASSVVVIYPLPPLSGASYSGPSGVTVVILTNLQDAGLYKVANEIALNFITSRTQQTAE